MKDSTPGKHKNNTHLLSPRWPSRGTEVAVYLSWQTSEWGEHALSKGRTGRWNSWAREESLRDGSFNVTNGQHHPTRFYVWRDLKESGNSTRLMGKRLVEGSLGIGSGVWERCYLMYFFREKRILGEPNGKESRNHKRQNTSKSNRGKAARNNDITDILLSGRFCSCLH